MHIVVERDDIYKITKFVLCKMNADLRNQCYVYVDFKHNDVYNGYVEHLDDDYYVVIAKKLEGEMLIRTVIHELIHVCQMMSGALVFEGRRKYWNNTDHSTTQYNDQPWELEAYELEEKFYQEYINAS